MQEQFTKLLYQKHFCLRLIKTIKDVRGKINSKGRCKEFEAVNQNKSLRTALYDAVHVTILSDLQFNQSL